MLGAGPRACSARRWPGCYQTMSAGVRGLADPHGALFDASCQIERDQWISAVRETQAALTRYVDMHDFWERQRMHADDDRDAALGLVAALAFWLRRSSR